MSNQVTVPASGNELLTSVSRTIVPVIAGLVVTYLGHFGISIDNSTIVAVLPGLIAVVYYGLFRWLELHVSTKFSWFLGSVKIPVYANPADVVVTPAPTPVASVAPVAPDATVVTENATVSSVPASPTGGTLGGPPVSGS